MTQRRSIIVCQVVTGGERVDLLTNPGRTTAAMCGDGNNDDESGAVAEVYVDMFTVAHEPALMYYTERGISIT